MIVEKTAEKSQWHTFLSRPVPIPHTTPYCRHTGYSRQPVGMSGRRAVGRAFVQVGRRDVEACAIRRELENADTTSSVRRRVGVAGTLSTKTHVARTFHAGGIAAAAAGAAATAALRRQLRLRLLVDARFFAFCKHQ